MHLKAARMSTVAVRLSRAWVEASSARAGQEVVDAVVRAAHHQPRAVPPLLRPNPGLAQAESSWGETVVQAASHLGHRQLLLELARDGVALDLFAACAIGDKSLARSMLSSGSLDACGIHSLPLLHFGVMSRDISVLRMLVDANVAPNPPHASLSALHSAVAIGSAAMIPLLIAAGVSTTAVDASFGATPYDWALKVGTPSSEIMDMLQVDRDSIRFRAADGALRSSD